MQKMDWKGITEKLQKYKYVALILCIGVALMLLPTGNDPGTKAPKPEQATDLTFDLAELEKELGTALSEIRGVGEATVVLSLMDTGEDVLAVDQLAEGETKTVIVSGGSYVQQPVRIKTNYPRFQGALVVCDGGGNAAVKLEVLKAVSAITGLSSDQISINQRK